MEILDKVGPIEGVRGDMGVELERMGMPTTLRTLP